MRGTGEAKKKGVVHDFARKRDQQIDLLEDEWVDKIMRIFEKLYSHESPNCHKTKRLNGIKAFLHRLNQWRNYIIGLDNDMRRILDIQYKYFYKRTKKGLIPLPRVLIQQWNRNYKNIIETLTEHGVIKLEKREYLRLHNHEKQETGQCRYYSLKS